MGLCGVLREMGGWRVRVAEGTDGWKRREWTRLERHPHAPVRLILAGDRISVHHGLHFASCLPSPARDTPRVKVVFSSSETMKNGLQKLSSYQTIPNRLLQSPNKDMYSSLSWS